jgi:hypothetical protein
MDNLECVGRDDAGRICGSPSLWIRAKVLALATSPHPNHRLKDFTTRT